MRQQLADYLAGTRAYRLGRVTGLRLVPLTSLAYSPRGDDPLGVGWKYDFHT